MLIREIIPLSNVSPEKFLAFLFRYNVKKLKVRWSLTINLSRIYEKILKKYRYLKDCNVK